MCELVDCLSFTHLLTLSVLDISFIGQSTSRQKLNRTIGLKFPPEVALITQQIKTQIASI
jgi:hypothetical protein